MATPENESSGTTAASSQDIESAVPPLGSSAVGLAAVSLAQNNQSPELTAGLLDYLQDQQKLGESQRAYIQDQQKLGATQREHLRLQMENLHEQRKLTISHMHWQHLNDMLRGTLQVLLVIIGLGIVIALGAMVWNARNDSGLVVEAFAVPPEIAARGYTGSVVAQRVIDRIATLQKLSENTSVRSAQSFERNWGDDFEVEIPETGVSLGELNRYLRQWLGHETRISGEVVRTGSGLSIQARADTEVAERSQGEEAAIDALIDQSADRLFAMTQPYRYAGSLVAQGKNDEAFAVYRALAEDTRAPATERAWAYAGWSFQLQNLGKLDAARAAVNDGIRADPSVFDNYSRLQDIELSVGHDEQALAAHDRMADLLAPGKSRTDVAPEVATNFRYNANCVRHRQRGDFAASIAACQNYASNSGGGGREFGPSQLLISLSLSHDLKAAGAVVLASRDSVIQGGLALYSMLLATAQSTRALLLEDWSLAEQVLEEGIAASPARALILKPWLAYAEARQGNFTGAAELIDATPTDCYPCLRVRGKIAALNKDWPAAERWFTEAAKQGPSMPFANTDWAEMLNAKGDADGAIVQAREAVRRGPKFADGYQAWGEALLAKSDYRGAIKQFEQASRLAPQWGRISIQWGVALSKLGRKTDAEAKFKAAEAVELVPSERALLATVR